MFRLSLATKTKSLYLIFGTYHLLLRAGPVDGPLAGPLITGVGAGRACIATALTTAVAATIVRRSPTVTFCPSAS